MFVVFKNSEMIACFEEQADAVAYWRVHGGSIVLYPDMNKETIFIGA